MKITDLISHLQSFPNSNSIEEVLVFKNEDGTNKIYDININECHDVLFDKDDVCHVFVGLEIKKEIS